MTCPTCDGVHPGLVHDQEAAAEAVAEAVVEAAELEAAADVAVAEETTEREADYNDTREAVAEIEADAAVAIAEAQADAAVAIAEADAEADVAIAEALAGDGGADAGADEPEEVGAGMPLEVAPDEAVMVSVPPQLADEPGAAPARTGAVRVSRMRARHNARRRA